MFEKILVAVDGSEHGLHAARMAAELARTMHSQELRVVVVFEAIPAYIGDPYMQAAIDARLKDAQSALKIALEEIGKVPSEIHTELLEGSPAEAIVEVSNTRQSDVIVMGSRGLGRWVGAILGSTSQKVVANANCPVLIVR